MLIYTKNCVLSLPGDYFSYLLDLLLLSKPASNPTVLETLTKLPKLLDMLPIRCTCSLFKDQTLPATFADITKKKILNRILAVSLVCYLSMIELDFTLPKQENTTQV